MYSFCVDEGDAVGGDFLAGLLARAVIGVADRVFGLGNDGKAAVEKAAGGRLIGVVVINEVAKDCRRALGTRGGGFGAHGSAEHVVGVEDTRTVGVNALAQAPGRVAVVGAAAGVSVVDAERPGRGRRRCSGLTSEAAPSRTTSIWPSRVRS